MVERKRIGLFPGSFNPAHFGHIDLARKAIVLANLDMCAFYVNSFNLAKRDIMEPLLHRVAMLKAMIGHDRMIVLDPDHFCDNPGEAYLPQEQVFLPIIEALTRSFDETVDVWLVRGSDNFLPVEQGGYIYPAELFAIPHVIGLRHADHGCFDYSMLHHSVLVPTETVSSSLVRQRIDCDEVIAPLVGDINAEYIRSNKLFIKAW